MFHVFWFSSKPKWLFLDRYFEQNIELEELIDVRLCVERAIIEHARPSHKDY